jgi:small acid-soluble spore protein K (minor)
VRRGFKLRNKAHGFPNQNNQKLEGEPRAKAEYASVRADGTINTHPQERMYASSHRENGTIDFKNK